MQDIDVLIAMRNRAKVNIKNYEARKAYLTVSELVQLKEWRATKRKLDKEVKRRLVQLPLF